MIPVNEPLLGEGELKNVIDCVKSGWISSAGSYISEFEKKFSAYCGVKHGIAVSNGTTALHAACAVLGLEPGDEVIMPAFTIISCALGIIYAGGKPVLVDAEPETWNMDISKIEEKITPKTKAIMAVHIYGHPADMDPIRDLAKKYDLKIIEDAAEAHGAEYRGKKTGGLGDISCFSFYANKIITTGEGGMVLTDSDAYAEAVRSFRNLCFDKDRRFLHEGLGHNFRLTNVQAAIGAAQMENAEKFVEMKRKNGALYNELLKGVPGLQLPAEKEWAKNVYWMYGVVLDEGRGMDAWEFGKKLAERGIGTRPFFAPMHWQPVFKKMGMFAGENYPVAERIARYGLYLPSGLTLTEAQIRETAAAVKEILK
jgi:perosamine synthetase